MEFSKKTWNRLLLLVVLALLIAFGLQHFAALNRKFDVKYLDRSDVIPMTRDAKDLMKGTWFDL